MHIGAQLGRGTLAGNGIGVMSPGGNPPVANRSSYPYALSGLGLYPDHGCYDSHRSSWLPYWLDSPKESECVYGVITLDPVTAAAAAAARAYEYLQYGTIPRPQGPGAPQPPTPTVPTGIPVDARTVEEALETTIDPEAFQKYQAEWAAYIASKEADGSYTPEGNPLLPDATPWKWVLIGGGVLLTVLLVSRR